MESFSPPPPPLVLHLTYRPIGQYPQVNDDLVPSYHLLLCCLDMLYGSSLMGKQKDLLNPDCPFLPEGVSSVDYTPPTDLPSVLLPLCSKYGGE